MVKARERESEGWLQQGRFQQQQQQTLGLECPFYVYRTQTEKITKFTFQLQRPKAYFYSVHIQI